MRILFCIRNSWYFRNVETTLREMLRRGHEITLVISNDLKSMSRRRNRFAASIASTSI